MELTIKALSRECSCGTSRGGRDWLRELPPDAHRRIGCLAEIISRALGSINPIAGISAPPTE